MRKEKFLLFVLTLCIAVNSQAQDNIAFKPEETDVMEKHKAELAERSRIAYEDAYATLCKKYSVPKKVGKQLRRLVRLCEERKSTYDYIIPSHPAQRIMAKQTIDSVFVDSIYAILIPYNEDIAGPNIAFALRYTNVLGLDEAQHEYLLQTAITMAHRLDKAPRLNLWDEEMETLQNTLDKEQQRRFFAQKNGIKAGKAMKDAWKRLYEAGLAAELDSVKDCSKAVVYYLQRERINDIYRYKTTERKRHIAELDKRKPLMVRMVDAIDKKTKAEKRKKEKEASIGKEFVW